MSFYGAYIKPYADEEVLNYSYWIARYKDYEPMTLADEPEESRKPLIVNNLVGWQYTSVGRIDGVNGNVDLSEFYGMHDNCDADNSIEQEESNNNPVNITYAAYTDKWWDEVTNREDWAGKCDNVAIKGLAVRVDRGSVKYRAHTIGGGWLPYVTGYDLNDTNNGFAGDLVNAIDAVEIIYYTSEEEATRNEWKYVHYVASAFNNDKFYPEQIDNIKDNNMDGYAGVFKNPIDKVQMWVE